MPDVKSAENIKSEGIIRNSFFIFKPLSFLIKFLKGPISDIVQIKMGFSPNNYYIMLIIIPVAAFFIYSYVKKNKQ